MRNVYFAIFLFLSIGIAQSKTFDKVNCTFNGRKLFGKIKYVKYLPDVRIKIVKNFPDLKVKIEKHLANSCGKWKIVNSLPELKVQIVDYQEDIKVQFVK